MALFGMMLRGAPPDRLASSYPPPPENERDYLPLKQWEATYRDQYVKDGKAVISSRHVRYSGKIPPLGTWAIEDFKGIHGREIAQLRLIPPGEIQGCENPFEMGRGEDVKRYAAWIAEGHQPPPVHAIVNDKGVYRISDGHRRLAACKLAGNKPVLAWVYPSMPHPQGLEAAHTDYPMPVGLTYEGLQAMRAKEG